MPRLFCLLLLLPASSAYSQGAYTFSVAPVTPDYSYTDSRFLARWPHVGLQEAKRLLGQPGVAFVDGRSYVEWEAGHLPGALALPVGEFDKRYAMRRSILRKAAVLVIYCHGVGCTLAETLAQLLAEKGHRNLAVFWAGYPAWSAAGLDLEDKDGKKVSASKALKEVHKKRR